jgi:hypothetical protein
MSNPLVLQSIGSLYERIVQAAMDRQFIVNDFGSYACMRRLDKPEIAWLQSVGRHAIDDLDFVAQPNKVRHLRDFFRWCRLEEDAATKGIPSPPAMRFVDSSGTPCDVFLQHHWYRPLNLRLTKPNENGFPELPINSLVVCKLIACRRNLDSNGVSDDVLDTIAILSCDRVDESVTRTIAQLIATDWQLEQTIMLGIRRVQAICRGMAGDVPAKANTKLANLLETRNACPVSRSWLVNAAISRVLPRWHHEQVPDPIV